MNPYEVFKRECRDEVRAQGEDKELSKLTRQWLAKANEGKYSYHYEWMGRPIIQYPQDILAMQEIIWSVQPDLIIETGIAHGGSLIFSAAMLELNASCGGAQDALVLGIDIDIREHNRAAIESHPMARRIKMIQGSSVAPEVVEEVVNVAKGYKRILVCLDSNHTHSHVLAELQAYAPLVSKGSYCVVFDSVIEDLPETAFSDRPWSVGDNPKTALREYLTDHPEFEIDREIDSKILISVAPEGYLKRIS